MAVTEIPFTQMTEAEWQTRLGLAACYRLVDLFGWSDLINTRITARVPGRHDHFLINPYGLLFEEVTASSLVKIDTEGNKVEPSECEVNSGGFALPSTVHMARPEVACVLHTHSIAGGAVSMQKDGLLPLNQHALQVRISESQGRMRTNRSTTLLDTTPPRLCCDTVTNATELTAELGEKAKPKAASRTASPCDMASAPAIAAWCSNGKAAAMVASSA